VKFELQDSPPAVSAEHKMVGRLVIGLLVLTSALIGAAAGLLLVYSVDLPRVNQLEHYRPSSITELYDNQGRTIGSFALQRRVVLRDEREGHDSRHLWAYLDTEGALHIDGQDLGPNTGLVGDDGEYEWFQRIPAGKVPRLVAILGGDPADDVLDILERHWTGDRSGELERLLRESDLEIERYVA